MKIPKVSFNYSFIYDKHIYEWNKEKYDIKNAKVGWRYAQKIQKKWDKIEKKVMPYLSKISGLKWQTDKIDAYISTYKIVSFSKPLTLCMCKDINRCILIAIHELIHNLIVQNLGRI
jgi:hypothetical protein